MSVQVIECSRQCHPTLQNILESFRTFQDALELSRKCTKSHQKKPVQAINCWGHPTSQDSLECLQNVLEVSRKSIKIHLNVLIIECSKQRGCSVVTGLRVPSVSGMVDKASVYTKTKRDVTRLERSFSFKESEFTRLLIVADFTDGTGVVLISQSHGKPQCKRVLHYH